MDTKVIILIICMVVCSCSVALFILTGGVGTYLYTTQSESESESESETKQCSTDLEIPKGRYIKLTIKDTDKPDNSVMNLAEVEVYKKGDDNTNIAKGKSATILGEQLGDFAPANLTDGLVLGGDSPKSFVHTKSKTDEIVIDLGAEYEIGRIKIDNRQNCCQDRAVGMKLEILCDDNITVVKTTPRIAEAKLVYTIKFPENTWTYN